MDAWTMNELNNSVLSNFVSINEQYARSARIDKDNIDQTGFIYSSSIDLFLNTLASHQLNSNQGAFTWTGPYGSGKSTLALSLISILAGEKKDREEASRRYEKATAEKIWKAFPPGEFGWNVISLVGKKKSLESFLFEEIEKRYESEFPFSAQLDSSSDKTAIILEKIEELINKPRTQNRIILFVDEMGKLLEAASEGDGDIYFYQLLAELASRSQGRFVIIGILHQTFQEYAASSSKKVRDEWGKVQGRYVDLSFNLTSSEQLELIASAINSIEQDGISGDLANKTFELLVKNKRAPSNILVQQMKQCWPLNPICALALGPISRRSYGQNQRSIFSFLASNEPLGFRDFINVNAIQDRSLYTISDLWSYLETNWGSSIAASNDSHHFANVKDALLRLQTMEDAREEHSNILKSISIFELTEQLTGISATQEALQIALNASSHKITRDTNFLLKNNLIIFKRYKNTFSLYEGSDFDLETELENAEKFVSTFNLSDSIKKFLPTEIVAKRHYLRTGSLRWMELVLCRPRETETVINKFSPTASNFGLLIIVDTNDEEEFQNLIGKYSSSKNIVFGRSPTHQELNQLLVEYLSLENISQNSNALLKDKVARRELRDRQEFTKSRIENMVNLTISETEWVFEKKEKVRLSQICTIIADNVFGKAPILKNELINRVKPSGSANSALRQLCYSIIKKENQQDLGYERYPAERGIYESLIKKNGLHQKVKNTHKFVKPIDFEEGLDFANLMPLWETTKSFLRKEKHRKISLAEIHQIWAKPPFGIKAGLFPLLSLMFYLTEKDSLAFYKEDIFSTKIEEIDIDYICRTPKFIELRWMDLDKDTKALLLKLSEAVSNITGEDIKSIEPLDVARSLVAIYDRIEPWAKKTQLISKNAKKIRSIFKRASDPAQLIFNDLPSIDDQIDMSNEKSLDDMVFKITDGLIELNTVFNNVLTRFRDFLLSELNVPGFSISNIEELNERAGSIKELAGRNDVETFIGRLSSLSPDLRDFEHLAANILNKPSKNWIDPDLKKLNIETTILSRQFNNLETMASIKGNKQTKYAFALVSHNNQLTNQEKMTSFELSKKELSEAENLSTKIKRLVGSEKKSGQKELLAALTLLINEREK